MVLYVMKVGYHRVPSTWLSQFCHLSWSLIVSTVVEHMCY
jgi:hypothetical protein